MKKIVTFCFANTLKDASKRENLEPESSTVWQVGRRSCWPATMIQWCDFWKVLFGSWGCSVTFTALSHSSGLCWCILFHTGGQFFTCTLTEILAPRGLTSEFRSCKHPPRLAPPFGEQEIQMQTTPCAVTEAWFYAQNLNSVHYQMLMSLQVCVGARSAVYVRLPGRNNTPLSHGYYFTPPQKATRTRPLSTVLLDAPTCSSAARTHTQDRRIQHTHASSFSSGGGKQQEGGCRPLYGVIEAQQVGDAGKKKNVVDKKRFR